MHRRAKPTVNANMKGQKLVTRLATWSKSPSRLALTEHSFCTSDCLAGNSASARQIGREIIAVLQRCKPVSSL